jgi:alpha-glucosidase
MGGPVTVRLSSGGYLGITEGNVRNYSGMRLRADTPSRTLSTTFWDNTWGDFKFDVAGGSYSPWRTVIVADDLTELVNSTIVSNVSDPPDPVLFADQSWIRPGKSLWSWLSEGGGSTSYTRQVDYINLADELGFDSILIDSGWESRFNGFNGQTKYQNLADLVDYGEARGVDVWVWKHIARTDTTHAQYDAATDPLLDPAKREQFFSQLEAAGVAGVKIDFVNQSFFEPGNSGNRSAEAQAAIQAYEDILAHAAQHHLMINFHGATKPTGFERTYPNEMTREGIRGLESSSANQRHNSILPFTRMVAGHADYTPTTFGTSKLTATGTTFAHQLALGGLFTSAVTNFGFSPEQIDSLDAASPLAVEYLKALPAVWDETRVVPGTQIGQLAMLARRSGSSWFLVGVNGTTGPMTVNDIDLSFLGTASYTALLITDNAQFAVNTQTIPFVTGSYSLDVSMISGGGFAALFQRQLNGVFGDLTQDGIINGDDVSAFIAGWKTTGWATPLERYMHGDLNNDGATNLTDVGLFRQALAQAGAAHLFTGVPEPVSAELLWVAACGLARLPVRRALPCGGPPGRG